MPHALIEREGEVAALAEAVRQASAGEGVALLVTGPAGIGKTALVGELARLAEAGRIRLLMARGGELERDITYGIVRQLLERTLWALPEPDRAAVLAGPASLALPAFSHDTVERSREAGLDHGLYWLTANLAEREPLALVVDDAHWADAASLRFLLYLVHRLEGLSVLVAAAARPAEPGGESRLLQLLGADPAVDRIEPRPLTEGGSARLLAERVGHSLHGDVVSATHEMAGGNPFFLAEIASTLRERDAAEQGVSVEEVRALAPPAVTRALLLRLGRLGDDARAMADALAVLGDGAALPDLAAVSGREGDALAEAWNRLSRAGLAATDAPEFVHPIVREAIYSDLPPATRRRLHEKAGRALAERGAALEQVSHHLIRTEPMRDPWVADTLHQAGVGALARGAPTTAVGMLARALAEPPDAGERGAVLYDLGRAELRAGDACAAASHLRAALDAETSPPARVEIATALAGALLVAEGTRGAVTMLAAEGARDGLDRELALRLEVERTRIGLFDRDLTATAQASVREFGRFAGTTPAERRALANAAIAESFNPDASAERVVGLARRALGEGALLADGPEDVLSVGMSVYALTMGEDLDTAARELEVALAFAQERGSAFDFFIVSVMRTDVWRLRGRPALAAVEGQAAWETARQLGISPFMARGVSAGVVWLVEALLDRGEHGAAREVVEDAIPLGDIETSEFMLLRHARGLVELAEGEPARALEDFVAVGLIARAAGYEDRTTPWRIGAALAHAALGHHDEAVALADEQLGLARVWGAPGGLGAALRARALADPAADDTDATLEDAIRVLRTSGHRLELARALIDLGTARRVRGQRTAAQAPFEEGMDLAAECEALPLAERAREELRVLGARPRRLRVSGIESLTASERRVAALARRGMTNREIAQTQFVTMKTVESHLASAYRKLDISSRRELPAELETGEAEPPGIVPA